MSNPALTGTQNPATTSGFAPINNPTFTGTTTAPEFSASGLTGATAASRYGGAVASGQPTTGTWAVGDYVIDQTGVLWICVTAGTPGTWANAAGTHGTEAFATNPTTVGGLGFKAANGDPAVAGVNSPLSSGGLTLARLVAQQAFTLGTIHHGVAVAVATPTAGDALSSTGAANVVNGSGNVTPNPNTSSFTLTTTSKDAGYPTSGIIQISGGHVMAYTNWVTTSMTVAANGYLAGDTIPTGVAITLVTNGLTVYNSTGVCIGATIDLAAATWNASGFKQSAVAQANAVAKGDVLWVGGMSVATTGVKLAGFSAQSSSIPNASVTGVLSATNLRWAQNGTGLSSAPGSITVGSNTNGAATQFNWAALS